MQFSQEFLDIDPDKKSSLPQVLCPPAATLIQSNITINFKCVPKSLDTGRVQASMWMQRCSMHRYCDLFKLNTCIQAGKKVAPPVLHPSTKEYSNRFQTPKRTSRGIDCGTQTDCVAAKSTKISSPGFICRMNHLKVQGFRI